MKSLGRRKTNERGKLGVEELKTAGGGGSRGNSLTLGKGD